MLARPVPINRKNAKFKDLREKIYDFLIFANLANLARDKS